MIAESEAMMVKTDVEISDQDLDQLSSLFRLLSDKTRLSILLKLCDGERNVTSLCEDLQLPQPTVSHHLGLLRMNNLVGNRRSGKQVFYTLSSIPDGDGTVMGFNVQNLMVNVKQRLAKPI